LSESPMDRLVRASTQTTEQSTGAQISRATKIHNAKLYYSPLSLLLYSTGKNRHLSEKTAVHSVLACASACYNAVSVDDMYTWPTGLHGTTRAQARCGSALWGHGTMRHDVLPCRAVSGRRAQLSAQARPYVSIAVLCRAHRHGSPPWLCRPVAAREESRSLSS
jgi:hypothetical protein